MLFLFPSQFYIHIVVIYIILVIIISFVFSGKLSSSFLPPFLLKIIYHHQYYYYYLHCWAFTATSGWVTASFLNTLLISLVPPLSGWPWFFVGFPFPPAFWYCSQQSNKWHIYHFRVQQFLFFSNEVQILIWLFNFF